MKNLFSLVFTLTTLLAITSISVLYSEGWRLNIPDGQNNQDKGNSLIIKTGMLAVRSIPDGAKVYINDKLTTATNDTIAALKPGQYKLKVQKEGFEQWEKDINVYAELVTDITAVLISQTPKLESLTNYDVKAFDLSKNYNDIAFLTATEREPGILILPLANSPLNILRNSSRPIIKDTQTFSPSLGTNIWWSFDDKELLVELNPKGYLLYNVENRNFLISSTYKNEPKQISDPQSVFIKWQSDYKTNFETPKIQQIEKTQVLPTIVKANIETAKITWSPDEKKFAIEIPNEQNKLLTDIYVYNSEESLPIDEKRLYATIIAVDLTKVKYTWYSDSYHLILVNLPELPTGSHTVSMIRIDGTNHTKIYTGALASDKAFSTPLGDKIIVMTSLKEGNASNIYGISIR